MNGHSLLIHKLNEHLVHAQAKNPSYSLRSLAKKLNIAPSAISEIRNGKRKISPRLAEKISNGLLLPPDEKRRILNGIAKSKYEHSSKEDQNFVQLTSDQFHTVGDWIHFAILSLMKVRNFQSSKSWMAHRLGVSQSCIENAIDRLKRLDLVTEKHGQLKRTSLSVQSTDEVSSLAVRKSHLQDLQLIQDRIEKTQLDLRDSTSITMAIDPSKIPEAKLLIRAFRDSLSDLLESGEKSEVYKFSCHLFPLTQGEIE